MSLLNTTECPSLARLQASMSALHFAVGGLRLQMCAAVLYVGSGNLNSGPCAGVAPFDSSLLSCVCCLGFACHSVELNGWKSF